MRRRILIRRVCFIGIICAFFWTFGIQAAEALTADEYIAAGEAQLSQQTFDGYLQASQTFQNGITEHPNDPVINAYCAFTRILDLLLSDEAGRFTPLASQFGLTWTGADLDTLEVDAPVNDDGDLILPVTAPSLEELRSFLAGSFLNALDASLANLDTATQQWTDGVPYIVGGEVAGTDMDVEVDLGDLYLFRALLKAFKALALIVTAYDLNVDSRELASMLNMEEGIGLNDFLARYQDFLKLLPTATTDGNGAHQLGDARTALIGAIDDYLTASEKIRGESGTTPGASELLEIDDCDLLFEEYLRNELTKVQTSLNDQGYPPAELVSREETWGFTDTGSGDTLNLYFEHNMSEGSFESADLSLWGGIECVVINGSQISVELWFENGEAIFTGTYDPVNGTISDGAYEWWDGEDYSTGPFTGLRTGTEEETFRINLNPLFGNGSGPYNVRDLFPEFNCCNMPIDGTVGHGLGDDATLGGILPDMTQDEWDMEGFPCSTIQIPEATMNVQDGSVADWNGIDPVFTDRTGEDDPDLQGSDLDRLYLAKDETYLYVRMSIADGPPNTNPVYTAEWPYYQAMYYFVQFRTDPKDPWNIPYHGVSFKDGNWRVVVHEDAGMIVHYEAAQGEAQAVGNDLEWRVPLEHVGRMSGRMLSTWIHWSSGPESISDSNDTCNLIEPLSTVSGTLTVPAYDGDGPVYIAVFWYDGSFNTDQDNCLRLMTIYPEEYSDGMEYVLNNLPVGENVFIVAWWDEDFNGIMTSGDIVQRTGSFVIAGDGSTVMDLEPAMQYAAGDRPFFRYCTVKAYQTPEGLKTAITAGVFDPRGTVPDTISSLEVIAPGGTTYDLGADNFEDGEYWIDVPGDAETGEYTFTVTNAEGNSATGYYYRERGTTIPLPDAASLQASGNLLTPKLSWGAVGSYEGDLFYRARIYDEYGGEIWTSWFTTTTSIEVPQGILQEGMAYSWRIGVFDGHDYWVSDNRARSAVIPLTIDNETPFFDYVQVYHRRDGNGNFTALDVGVNDPNGSIPGNIATLEVSGPEGFYYQFTEDDLDLSSNTYYYKYANVPRTGIYTFTVTDTQGKSAVSCDYMEAAAIPFVDSTTLQASGNPLAPILSWCAPEGMDRHLYYRVIVEDLESNRVWSTQRIAETAVMMPQGVLQTGGEYQWYVRAYDDDVWIHFNDESRCARVPLTIAIDNAPPIYRWAVVYKLNLPDGVYTALDASVFDPDGLMPDTITSLTVTGPGEFSANLRAGEFYSADGEFYLDVPGAPQPGFYTFTMQDNDGNTTITHAYLEAIDTISPVDANTISFNGDFESPVVSWEGVSGFPGHLYYRLRIYDEMGAQIYRTGREATTARFLPGGLVEQGHYYSARVEAQNHWTWGIYDSRSNSELAGWILPEGVVTAISGKVTDPLGNGIPGVGVSLATWLCADQFVADTVTDENGDYSFGGLEEGTYYVFACATCNDLNYVNTWYGDYVADCNGASPVSVATGENRTGIDITLETGVSISGTVYQADGETPVDAQIRVALIQGNPCGEYQEVASTETNPLDGTYGFIGLPAGSYYLRTENNQQSNYLNEWWTESGSSFDCGEAQAITVSGGDVRPATQFQLDLGGSISGTVYESDGVTPIVNCDVYAEEYATGIWSGGAQTDEKGDYIIRALPTGTYRIRACASCSDLPYVDECYDDIYNGNNATPVAVTAPDDTPGIDFLLDSGGTISGTVYEAGGVTPIAGCHVYAESEETGEWFAGDNTDENGDYTLRVPTGNYRVRACASCSDLPFSDEWYDNTYNVENAAVVEVTAPSDTPGIDFSLDSGGTISGTVYEADGVTPIAGCHVYAETYDSSVWMGGANTDESGHYTIVLPSGTYRVKTCAYCCDGLPYIGKIYNNTYSDDEAVPVEVVVPNDTPGIDFTLDDSLVERQTTEEAVEDGLAWLAGAQNPDGSWGTEHGLAKAAMAVVVLSTNAIDTIGLSPLDPSYQYHLQVVLGLDYIFLQAFLVDIGVQSAGNPDGDGDGIGVYFNMPEGPYSIYYTSMVMMAIASSNAPDRVVNVSESPVNGWTYREVLQDMVDYTAWAQTDSGYGRGGWSYDATDNIGDRSDQSNSGWVTVGLAYAEAQPPEGFGINIPQFVKSELNYWINYIQDDDGGSCYEGDDGTNLLRTGNLIQQMMFYGDAQSAQRVQDAVDYMIQNWDTDNEPGWNGCPTCYHETYTVMKGLEALGTETLDSIDWYEDLRGAIMAEQSAEGWWPVSCYDDGDFILSTEWSILTLQKAVPHQPDLVVVEKNEEWVDEGAGTYTVSYTVENRGNVEVPAGHDVGLIIDGGAVEQQEILISLAPGETFSGLFDAVTLSGTRDEVTVCADVNDEVSELVESNNCLVNGWPTPLAGDINNDGVIDLADVVLALKVLAGLNPAGVDLFADVNGDGKIGVAEIAYILQYLADLRGITECWEADLYQTGPLGLTSTYIGDLDFTLRKHLDGSVTADGTFDVTLSLFGQQLPLDGSFHDHPVTIDGNTLSTTYTDTVTLGEIETDVTVNLDGITNNGTVSDGTWTVDFESNLLPDMNGTWDGTRVNGEGITE